MTSLFCIFCKKKFEGVITAAIAAPTQRPTGGGRRRLAVVGGGPSQLFKGKPLGVILYVVIPVYGLDIRHVYHDAFTQRVQGYVPQVDVDVSRLVPVHVRV